MLDPARPEVADAVARCRAAGIRPVMITGDHPLTARHIAKQIGITESEEFLTGQDLDRLTDAELRDRVNDVSVFARVSPEHKIRLVTSLQEQGLVVAMTGDGVNDAPALRKADIGVAMGITGTDVSRDAADMVLLDDNFATIVAAVEEGRKIYDNIRKFIKYLLSCNASEIAVMLLAPLFGMPLPLLPLQILWMNLVTDGLPALALGVEPAEENIMKRPPYSSEESIFGRGLVGFVVVMGSRDEPDLARHRCLGVPQRRPGLADAPLHDADLLAGDPGAGGALRAELALPHRALHESADGRRVPLDGRPAGGGRLPAVPAEGLLDRPPRWHATS